MKRLSALGVVPAAAVVGLAGCGGSAGVATAPAARSGDFPAGAGRTVSALVAGLPRGPIFAASVSVFRRGSNRVGFALFTPDRKEVTTAEAALYTADGRGGALAGPFPAHEESLAVAPQFASETVARDPLAAHAVYVANVRFPANGKRELIALVRVGGRLAFAGGATAEVGRPGGPPDVGQPAIRIHTPTVSQVGARGIGTIDTRSPPEPALEKVDFASVLGRQPVVLLFATPALCQSRVCGPVVDIEDQVRSEAAARNVAFVHMEIYTNNDVNQGFRSQVGAWRLPTEPWAFIVDRGGRIADRLEGAFSVAELRAAVAKVA